MKGFEGRSELAARLHRLGRHLPVFEAPGLLTTYARGERFGDGTLENAFEAGMLTAIMRRAGILAAELERGPSP